MLDGPAPEPGAAIVAGDNRSAPWFDGRP